MKKLLFLLALLPGVAAAVTPTLEDLFAELDDAIASKHLYSKQKEDRIREMKRVLKNTPSGVQQYFLARNISEEYSNYNIDSAFHYTDLQYHLAVELGDREAITESKIDQASLFAYSGMFHISIELLDGIDRGSVPESLLPKYYHSYRTNYEAIWRETILPSKKEEFYGRMSQYRDSLLTVLGRDDISHTFVTSAWMADEGRYGESLGVLRDRVDRGDLSVRDLARLNYSFGRAYSGMGQRDSAKYYYTLASIEDMTSAAREYLTLQNLALMLYEEGDIGRAYRYISNAIEDALEANARMNIPFMASILPVVSNAYEHEMQENHKQLRRQLWIISGLLAALCGLLIVLYAQMKRLKNSQRSVNIINQRLSGAIANLENSNARLHEANSRLRESNTIKETYVARYMDLCSDYIGRVEKYRSHLNKVARNDGAAEVVNELRSSAWLDDELREFYNNFDVTFLHLFPGFVEKFNALLREEERIVLKPGKLLNTELRIFALVRLGITDSVKIAEFLRYSVKTVYNYRVKLRNAALNDREEFENQVMRIGSDS